MEEIMFDKEFRFTGKHAKYVTMLSNNFGSTKSKLFDRNVDVYVRSPIVGFLFQRKSEKDFLKDENGKVFDAHILRDQVLTSKENLIFNMQLILLLDKSYEADETKRVDKAFKNFGKDESDLELFESYVRGGIEVLYEKLIQNGSTSDDYIQNLADFTDEINEMHNSKVDIEKLQKLCAV